MLGIQGDLLSLAPRVHHQSLPVVKKMTESREDPNIGQREQNRTRSRSRTKHSGNDNDDVDGPVPLSGFFESVKSWQHYKTYCCVTTADWFCLVKWTCIGIFGGVWMASRQKDRLLREAGFLELG